MVQPLVKRKIVKKKTKHQDRHQSDRIIHVKVRSHARSAPVA